MWCQDQDCRGTRKITIETLKFQHQEAQRGTQQSHSQAGKVKYQEQGKGKAQVRHQYKKQRQTQTKLGYSHYMEEQVA